MTTTGTSPAPTGAPIAATATPAAASTLSIVAFVLGLASVLLGFTFLVPLAAIVLGVMGYRREPNGHVFAIWGIVLGGLVAFGWIAATVIGALLAAPLFFLF